MTIDLAAGLLAGRRRGALAAVIDRERVGFSERPRSPELPAFKAQDHDREPDRSRFRPAVRRSADRNDALDGLRFVAVAAVLAFHFGVPGADAGFLGVDLFFVLSGFVITSILLRQVEEGRVRLADFWARRVRRLAPAVLLALAALIAWGALEASMTLRDDLRGDITATLAYVANWHFIDTSSYFHATGDPSPLLHMWTLAVEEQFYVLWPLTLFVLALVVPRRVRLPLVAVVAASGVIASAWRLESLWLRSETTERAYMGADSRMFGPLLGAVLAVVLVRAPRLGASRRPNTALLVIGSGVLAWGMLALGSATGPTEMYPRGGALLFGLGSAAVIWAVSTRASGPSAIIALPPIAYLGRISYGIYIWHWPLVIWADAGWIDMTSFPTPLRVIALTAATVAIASLSYHAVEKPIRYGAIGRRLSGRRIAVLLPATLVTLIAINIAGVVPHAGAEIAAQTDGAISSGVTVSPVTKTVLLVGDSVPQGLQREFADAAAKHDWVVINAARGGCPATAVSKAYSTGVRFKKNTCPKAVRTGQDTSVKKYRPALVIWWDRYEIAPRLGPDGKLLPLGSRAYWRAQRASFEQRAHALTKRGARLVAVQIERPGPILAVRNPTEEGFLVGQTLLHRRDVVRAWNAYLARYNGPKVFSIAIERWVCRDAKNPCDDRLLNGQTARRDGVHYSHAVGRLLAPRILDEAWRVARLDPTLPS
jgi:peptidoglycan/LPS O-acetylase OafA/YrhL